MTDQLNILIADDHKLFLEGLKLIFSDKTNWKIVAEASNGSEVIEAFGKHKIDLAILDVNMPKPNGIELSKHIISNYPECKVLMLTMYGDEQFINELLKIGVHAYVLKNAGKVELMTAIYSVLQGQRYISKDLNHTNENDDSFVKSLMLTQREKEIITLLAKEKSSQEIADILFISVYTVNTHRKNILNKLGIKNTAGLMKFASENNLL